MQQPQPQQPQQVPQHPPTQQQPPMQQPQPQQPQQASTGRTRLQNRSLPTTPTARAEQGPDVSPDELEAAPPEEEAAPEEEAEPELTWEAYHDEDQEPPRAVKRWDKYMDPATGKDWWWCEQTQEATAS